LASAPSSPTTSFTRDYGRLYRAPPKRDVLRLHTQTQQALAPLTDTLDESDQRLLQGLLQRMLEGRGS
jgi:hypothetical protein